jgi:hypothetical protein
LLCGRKKGREERKGREKKSQKVVDGALIPMRKGPAGSPELSGFTGD